MPRLQAQGFWIGFFGPVGALRHLRGMVTVIGARAIDRRRPQHRRTQPRLHQRHGLGLRSAFCQRLAQSFIRLVPIFQDAEHAGVRRLAAQFGGVEHSFFHHDAGARALHGLVRRQLVSGHFSSLPCLIYLSMSALFSASQMRSCPWPEPRLSPAALPSRNAHSSAAMYSTRPPAASMTACIWMRALISV